MSNMENLFLNAFKSDADCVVKEAILYSILAKSKHVRARLLMALLQDHGIDPRYGEDAAVALEMIQTYSLIHDDLPAMDDDDMRRGQPANHIQFNEAIAILAGDGLLTKAFEHLAQSEYDDIIKVALIKELAHASGISGMIYGQVLDMDPDHLTSNNDILKMYALKTGMLFGAAMAMGAILANQGDKVENYRTIGQALGIAFQVQDDVLEMTKTQEELGKSKSDEKNEKKTLSRLSGKEGATYIQNNAFSDVFESLALIKDHPVTVELIKSIQDRGF